MGSPVCLLNRRPQGHRRSSRLLSARSLTTYTLGRWPSKERHRAVTPDLVSRLRRWCKSIPAHQLCSGDAIGRRVRSRAAFLRVRSSPRAPSGRLAQSWQTRWSQKPVVPGSTPGPATKFSGQWRNGLRSARKTRRLRTLWVQLPPGLPRAPVADGEADGLQSRCSRFESVPGCQCTGTQSGGAA